MKSGPNAEEEAAGGRPRLDDLVSAPYLSEWDETRVTTRPEDVWAALRELRPADLALSRAPLGGAVPPVLDAEVPRAFTAPGWVKVATDFTGLIRRDRLRAVARRPEAAHGGGRATCDQSACAPRGHSGSA